MNIQMFATILGAPLTVVYRSEIERWQASIPGLHPVRHWEIAAPAVTLDGDELRIDPRVWGLGHTPDQAIRQYLKEITSWPRFVFADDESGVYTEVTAPADLAY